MPSQPRTRADDVAPAMRAYIDNLNEVVVPAAVAAGFRTNVINAREALANLTAVCNPGGPRPVARVLDDTIADPSGEFDVPVRIFTDAPDEGLPVLVYLHGGGHMVGSVTVYDPVLRRLATETRHVVVAPEYRLSPEHRRPAAEHDTAVVMAGVLEMLEARGVRHQRRVSLAGDSAGGALATCWVRDHQDDDQHPVHRQVLVYPSVDYTMGLPSIDENGRGLLLEKARIAWYFDHYFRPGDDRRAASPLHGRFSAAMPRTLLVAGGFDPLRDEGLAYADRMNQVGASCEVLFLADMPHTFFNMYAVAPQAVDRVMARVADFLNS